MLNALRSFVDNDAGATAIEYGLSAALVSVAAIASLQMPPGTPVAAVGIDNGRNGALMAARILGTSDAALRDRLRDRVLRDRARYEPARISAEVEKRKQARRSARGE